MAQDEDIFGQADALMRRHRSFVARGGADDNHEMVPAEHEIGAADIPLLTEIVEVTVEPHPGNDLVIQRTAIENEFDGWLQEVLPAHIDKLAEQIAAQLFSDLVGEARASLLPRLLEALEAQQGKE